MPVQIQSTGSVTVASLSGEIDHHLAGPMRIAIDDACTASAARTLVLDFGGVTFMDSSGVGLVMGRYKLMQALEGELILSNLPAPIRRVMRMAGLDRLAVIDPGRSGRPLREAAAPAKAAEGPKEKPLPEPTADAAPPEVRSSGQESSSSAIDDPPTTPTEKREPVPIPEILTQGGALQ